MSADPIILDDDAIFAMISSHEEWCNSTGKKGNRAEFENVIILDIDLSGKSLDGIIFKDCNITSCNFSGSSLIKSSFFGSTVIKTKYIDTNAADASFSKAKLDELDFERATLSRVDFSGADIWNVKNAVFDDCITRTANINTRKGEAWSELKKDYSGVFFILYTIMLMAFFIPNIASFISILTASTISERVPSISVGYSYEEASVFEVFLGGYYYGTKLFYLSVAMSLYIIIFYSMRSFTTFMVAILNENEWATGRTPKKESFSFLRKLHVVIKGMGYGALALLAINSIAWLTLTIKVPLPPS